MNHEFLSTVFLLLLLLDPLGNIPVVMSLLRQAEPARRQRIVLRESAIACLFLVVSVFVGDALLAAMRLTDPALEISGGLILFLIALRMVFPPPASHEADPLASEPFIVPLAIPMIAGPSVLATVLLAARQADGQGLLIAAIGLACAINTGILLAGGAIARLLGKAGMAALERLMGLVLTALAVQMLISGIRIAFQLNGAAAP